MKNSHNRGRKAPKFLTAAAAVILAAGSFSGCGTAKEPASPAIREVPETAAVLKTETLYREPAAETGYTAPEKETVSAEPSALPAAEAFLSPTESMQVILSHYGELLALDHYGVFIGSYQDRPYIRDVYAHHAYAMGPEELDGDFFDNSARHSTELFYGVQDLDGDGQPELLIGESMDRQPARLLRIFYGDGSGMQSVWGEYGSLLKDGTILSMAGSAGEIRAVLHLRNSRPEPVEYSDIPLDVTTDWEAFQKIVQNHGGEYTVGSWLPIPVSTDREEYSSASGFEEIEDRFRTLTNGGRAMADRKTEYGEVIGQFMPERLKLGPGQLTGPCFLYSYRTDVDLDNREELLIGYGSRGDDITLLALYQEDGGRIRIISGDEAISWGYEIPAVGPRAPYAMWNELCRWQ